MNDVHDADAAAVDQRFHDDIAFGVDPEMTGAPALEPIEFFRFGG
jgi:hypothetical protein